VKQKLVCRWSIPVGTLDLNETNIRTRFAPYNQIRRALRDAGPGVRRKQAVGYKLGKPNAMRLELAGMIWDQINDPGRFAARVKPRACFARPKL
jgi:hypothetical protein